MRLGPCDPKPNTRQKTKNSTRRGPTLRPRGAPPGPHSGEGRDVERPGPAVGRAIGGPSSKTCEAAKQNRRGETKTKHKKHGNTLAASRPKKGPRKGRASSSPISSRRIPKTRGAQNGTPKKRQETGRTAKKGDEPTTAGQKGEKEKTNTSACGGVLLLPALYLLQQKEKEKETASTNNQRKRERTHKQKT